MFNANKTKGLVYTALAYVLAVAVSIGIGYYCKQYYQLHWLLTVLIADIAATVVIFIFSFLFNNSSFYDPYWSIQPIVIGAFYLWLQQHNGNTVSLRAWLVFACVVLWGCRLTYNFYRGWPGIEHQDWRYNDLEQQNGKAYWFISFAGIHLFPTILVYAGCLAMYAAMVDFTNNINIIDIFALLFTLSAICIETIADEQLLAFKKTNTNPKAILQTGLWAHSRHPNYLGEVMFWWGLYFFALAAAPAYWWTIVGPLSITLLFVFISIPLIDKRMIKRRPQYKQHRQKIPAIIPNPFKKQ